MVHHLGSASMAHQSKVFGFWRSSFTSPRQGIGICCDELWIAGTKKGNPPQSWDIAWPISTPVFFGERLTLGRWVRFLGPSLRTQCDRCNVRLELHQYSASIWLYTFTLAGHPRRFGGSGGEANFQSRWLRLCGIHGKNPRIGIFIADADDLIWELKISEKLLGEVTHDGFFLPA